MTSSLEEDLLSHRGYMHGHLGAILVSLGGVWGHLGQMWGHLGATRGLEKCIFAREVCRKWGDDDVN